MCVTTKEATNTLYTDKSIKCTHFGFVIINSRLLVVVAFNKQQQQYTSSHLHSLRYTMQINGPFHKLAHKSNHHHHHQQQQQQLVYDSPNISAVTQNYLNRPSTNLLYNYYANRILNSSNSRIDSSFIDKRLNNNNNNIKGNRKSSQRHRLAANSTSQPMVNRTESSLHRHFNDVDYFGHDCDTQAGYSPLLNKKIEKHKKLRRRNESRDPMTEIPAMTTTTNTTTLTTTRNSELSHHFQHKQQKQGTA